MVLSQSLLSRVRSAYAKKSRENRIKCARGVLFCVVLFYCFWISLGKCWDFLMENVGNFVAIGHKSDFGIVLIRSLKNYCTF